MEFIGKTFDDVRDEFEADCIDFCVWKADGEKVAQIVWCGDTHSDPDFISILDNGYSLSALYESEIENVSRDEVDADCIYIDAIANELYER